ncbi:hypothetical protein BO70DRAFT_287518 [Aspergillus heteromorphus CBS 117.55]|uniref:DUF6536 domain-containing protein n=1 Tax=Aspergillus heteromorphus CBS 117.55 TaxID=1448321 RepID=A0A317WQH2_9EURO|nr:uncharacterized protein BO70DRAFT_287518 [Aspergillus heteromorphus CBS 117.55]PWY87377.1 hypothetical protein BO70DRAFT_287518 [Aspergillus heteromorphus CBS 117.55]
MSTWKLSGVQDRRKKWVKGVLVCAYATSAVFVVNVILTIVATAIAVAGEGQRTLTAVTIFQGSCGRTKGWTTGLHLVINVLSTVVLAASSYCMQCLSSPSRTEIDRAHAERVWLDVGVSSLRNLTFAGWTRRALWLALMMTSVPIHLIYNSAVFFSLGTTEYNVVLAPADFDFDHPPTHPNASYADCFPANTALNLTSFYTELPTFQNLTTQDCIKRYATNFPANLGTLILVTRNGTVASDSLEWVVAGNPTVNYGNDELTSGYGWMCQANDRTAETAQSCDESQLLQKANEWSIALRVPWSGPVVNATMDLPSGPTTWPTSLNLDVSTLEQTLAGFPTATQLEQALRNETYWQNQTWAQAVRVQATEARECALDYQVSTRYAPSHTVDYCLSQAATEHCELQFSPMIALLVLACNIVKIVCMFLTARTDRRDIFLTVGDAVASFLTRPDPTTAGMGLLSRANLTQGPQPWRSRRAAYWRLATKQTASPRAQPWAMLVPRQRWMAAVRLSQWVGTILVCLGVMSLGGYFLSTALQSLRDELYRTTMTGLWDLGFGTATPYTIIPFRHSTVIAMALLANCPQLVVSTAYFLYNNLLTHMLLVAEYDDYASQRKPLRVSWPEGVQRSSYYLSLPYRYSLPLAVASMVLHWLVSASLFYVEVIPFDTWGNAVYNDQIIACGYAPIGIICAILLGFVMTSSILILGLRRLQSHMPLAGSCSAAISAACHPQSPEEHALKPIMWGEILVSPEARADGEQSAASDGDRGDLDGGGKDGRRRRGYSRLAEGSGDGEGGHGHCSFTCEEVTAPSLSRMYI